MLQEVPFVLFSKWPPRKQCGGSKIISFRQICEGNVASARFLWPNLTYHKFHLTKITRMDEAETLKIFVVELCVVIVINAVSNLNFLLLVD